MKQIIVVFVCIMMVMLIGYVVQKEDMAFGPMTVLADPLPPEADAGTEIELVPEEANAGSLTIW
ncbi:hypothetical protein AGMMS49942_05740 [Spirochaetia bacterium]|nr:hypothetical protein AGMMS49942_05740 [Spirochaetia bacterium]